MDSATAISASSVIHFLQEHSRAEIRRWLCHMYDEVMSDSWYRKLRDGHTDVHDKSNTQLWLVNTIEKLTNSISPYIQDLAPSDYHCYTKMKDRLATQCFTTSKELMDGLNNWLDTLAELFFDKRLQKLVLHYKCLNLGGTYTEE